MMLRGLSQCLSFSSSWRFVQWRGANRTVLVKLLKNVEKLGEIGDVIRVKPGRMRHELYPSKQAIYVPFGTPITIKEKKIVQEHVPKTDEEIIREQLSKVIDKLTSKEVDIRRPLREGEPEDVEITPEIVCRFVRERLGISLSPSLLHMPQPLTQSGEHVIPLMFKYDGRVDHSVKVTIVDKSATEVAS